MRAFNRLHDGTMTAATGLLSDGSIARPYGQRLMKSPGGESERVPEAIRGLGHVFGQKAGWCVTIIADRSQAMARLDPAVILLLHNVAVGARRRIIRQV